MGHRLFPTFLRILLLLLLASRLVLLARTPARLSHICTTATHDGPTLRPSALIALHSSLQATYSLAL